jgi:hypothetical protein
LDVFRPHAGRWASRSLISLSQFYVTAKRHNPCNAPRSLLVRPSALTSPALFGIVKVPDYKRLACRLCPAPQGEKSGLCVFCRSCAKGRAHELAEATSRQPQGPGGHL